MIFIVLDCISSSRIFYKMYELSYDKRNLPVAIVNEDITQIFEFIKDNSDCILVPDRRGWTPLHIAAYIGNWKILDLFLNLVGDINIMLPINGNTNFGGFADDGKTLLNICIDQNNEELFQYLLSRVTTEQLVDNCSITRRKSLLNYAIVYGTENIFNMLFERIVNHMDKIYDVVQEHHNNPFRLSRYSENNYLTRFFESVSYLNETDSRVTLLID